MKLLDRYIAKTVLAAISLVILMLVALQVFILFVNQLGDLGKADYGLIKATIYVFLQMPYQVYLFFPMASLLGSLIGLGIMANHHELVVMRASGVSIGQIINSVLKVALIIIAIVTIAGETLIPKFSHYANEQKALALSGGQTLRTAHGVWLRYQNDFIFIGTIVPQKTLMNVDQFRFDNDHRLSLSRKIAKIDYLNDHWQAQEIAETIINNDHTKTRKIASMAWDVLVKPSVLGVHKSEPDEMTLQELRQFLRAQKHNHETALHYKLVYWQRLIQPLTTIIMMVLAIPFIFGPLRSSTMGSKLLVGATAGFGFHILNRFLGPISQVFQWPVEIAALSPTCLFALLGFYFMRRAK
jgi:lipopolysaccharide export system permease protein